MEDARKQVTQVRMDPVLKKRIRKYRDQLQKKANGIEISFSEAARSLIEMGLDRAGVR
jgi:hypothetical protein